jgi:hypothetical protein
MSSKKFRTPNVFGNQMFGEGDKKPTPVDIWEGVMDLVNGNMFTHYRQSLSPIVHAI